MSINWQQKAWCNVKVNGKPERRCWRWEGTRRDGRTFRIVHIPHLRLPYVCTSFNGMNVGSGRNLAEAQKAAEMVPCVKINPPEGQYTVEKIA